MHCTTKTWGQLGLVFGAAWLLSACAVSHNNPEGTNRHEVTIQLGSDDEPSPAQAEEKAPTTSSAPSQEPPSRQEEDQPARSRKSVSEKAPEETPSSKAEQDEAFQRHLQDLEWKGEFYMKGLSGPDHHRLEDQKQDRTWSEPAEAEDSEDEPLLIDPR